ncbi:hypothetical protein ACFLTV_00105 [Chloroflexota bacterium]
MLLSWALDLANLQGLDVSFEPRPYQDPAIKGMYSGKTIWVRPEESRAQQLKTLLHEMAHYFSEGVFRMPRRTAETIAESVAFTVGAHFGFDSGVRSFPYVALSLSICRFGKLWCLKQGSLPYFGTQNGITFLIWSY